VGGASGLEVDSGRGPGKLKRTVATVWSGLEARGLVAERASEVGPVPQCCVTSWVPYLLSLVPRPTAVRSSCGPVLVYVVPALSRVLRGPCPRAWLRRTRSQLELVEWAPDVPSGERVALKVLLGEVARGPLFLCTVRLPHRIERCVENENGRTVLGGRRRDEK